jgi:hypothetical protein
LNNNQFDEDKAFRVNLWLQLVTSSSNRGRIVDGCCAL